MTILDHNYSTIKAALDIETSNRAFFFTRDEVTYRPVIGIGLVYAPETNKITLSFPGTGSFVLQPTDVIGID